MNWLIISGMAVIVFTNRYFFLTKNFIFAPSENLKMLLSFSAPSVLTAIWVPIIFHINEHGVLSLDMTYGLSAIFVTAAALMRINLLLVVMMGMTFFFVIRMIIKG